MKKTTLLTLLTAGSVYVYAGGDIVPMEPTYAQPQQTLTIQEDKQLYVYLMGGSAIHSIDSKKNISFREGALDDTPAVVDLGVGYAIADDVLIELAYQRRIFDYNDIDNFYVSLNYVLAQNGYKPYIGALAGYSSLTWNTDPTQVLYSFDKTSTSALFGLQTGLQIPVSADFAIVAKYQFMTHTHALDVRTTSSAIENKYSHTILGGIKYEF